MLLWYIRQTAKPGCIAISINIPRQTMAVTAAEVLADLAIARKTLNEWECGPITIDVCNSSSNDISKSINFTETIGHQRRVPKTGRRDDDNCYWLNAEWNRNDDDIRQTLIIPYFVSAASHAGCRIHGSWEHRFKSIRFQCFRGKKNYSSYCIDYYNTTWAKWFKMAIDNNFWFAKDIKGDPQSD